MIYTKKWKINPDQVPQVFEGVQSVAKRFIMKNFQSQSFDGNSWKQKKKPDGRAILVGKSKPHMKQSFHFAPKGRGTTRITNSKPYSGYHNDGTSKLPQRQMIGDSKTLFKMVERDVKRRMNKLFK